MPATLPEQDPVLAGLDKEIELAERRASLYVLNELSQRCVPTAQILDLARAYDLLSSAMAFRTRIAIEAAESENTPTAEKSE